MFDTNFLKIEISKLYRKILLREPDREGLRHWMQEIT